MLSLKQWREANAIIAAHARGNSVAALELLSPLLPPLNDKQLAALDEFFAERHTPSAAQIITNAHLGMVLQGFSNKLHRPKAHETLILVPEVHRRLFAILREHDGHVIKDEPLLSRRRSKPTRRCFGAFTS